LDIFAISCFTSDSLYTFFDRQEAQDKITALQEFPITWHFIGPIQSNKTQAIALNFSWVHSVEREKIATLLSKYRPDDRPPLQILIQVNLDHETSKAGVFPEAITPLAHYIDSLPNLQLRGLMTIPGVREDEESQYRSFLRLSDLMLSLFKDTLKQVIILLVLGAIVVVVMNTNVFPK